jgi:hypothetical protein
MDPAMKPDDRIHIASITNKGIPMQPITDDSESFKRIFIPTGPADAELEWFFTQADSDIVGPSAFVANLARVLDEPGDTTMEERAEAAHAQRKILRWMQEIGDHDAGVLKVAYTARPWPLKLREKLGRLTGVVVRIAAAEVGLPDDDLALDALERRTAERLGEAPVERAGPMERLQRAASPLLRRAFVAYVRERGGRERPVLRGVS